MPEFSSGFDPFAELPLCCDSERWLYGAYEYENFLHRKLSRIRYRAKLLACYPGAFPLPAFEMQFRAELPAGTYRFCTHGETEILGAKWTSCGENLYTLTVNKNTWITLRLQVDANDTPALWTDAPAECEQI